MILVKTKFLLALPLLAPPTLNERLLKFFADENPDVGGNAAYYVQEMVERGEGSSIVAPLIRPGIPDLLKLILDPACHESGLTAIIGTLANAFSNDPKGARAFMTKEGENYPYLSKIVQFLKENKLTEPCLILSQNLFYALKDGKTGSVHPHCPSFDFGNLCGSRWCRWYFLRPR